MADVPHDGREEPSERSVHHRLVERGVTHAGADAKPLALDREPPQRRHAVDVDEMGGTREAKRHDRHQALAAGEHAPILGGNLAKGFDRFRDRLRRVVAKRRGLHRSSP